MLLSNLHHHHITNTRASDMCESAQAQLKHKRFAHMREWVRRRDQHTHIHCVDLLAQAISRACDVLWILDTHANQCSPIVNGKKIRTVLSPYYFAQRLQHFSCFSFLAFRIFSLSRLLLLSRFYCLSIASRAHVHTDTHLILCMNTHKMLCILQIHAWMLMHAHTCTKINIRLQHSHENNLR